MNSTMTATEAKAIAREAYLFAFPMLMGYRFAYATYLQLASPAYRGPANSGPFGKAVPSGKNRPTRSSVPTGF
jgi:hypothetical protein